MEEDQQGPYSVLSRDDLKEKMKKQIDEISEIFLVSKSDATVLLMYLRWDSLRVSERLSENKEKLLSESGLKPLVIDPEFDASCGICFKTCDEIVDDDDDGLISTMFCSHKFCKTCWRDYLQKNFFSLETNQTVISCPDQDCRSAVGPDTIEKLTEEDKEMYEKYVLRSYIEENKFLMIKSCPVSGCDYFIEFHEDETDEEHSLNVVCLCGHTFCWRCKLESHRPVTCNNASDWLSTVLTSDESLSRSSNKTDTRLCPNCLSAVDMSGSKYLRFLTCTCRFRFCWKCMRSEESHKNESGFYRACLVPVALTRRADPEVSSGDRWKDCEISMEKAKCDLQAFDIYINKEPGVLREQDIRIVREGMMLIVQCRQVLKWTCAYDHFHTEYEISKKEYLRFLQDNATTTLQSYVKKLLDETKEASYAETYEEIGNFRDRLSTATNNIGNYFYLFIKNLQDGLVDVKVNSYDGFLVGPYWFCDRCTFGNTWFDKECKMCCYPTTYTLEELSGLSLN